MKNLVILISLLLLSSLLTSCEKNEETLYKWKTSSGWEWKTMGDKNNNPQYKGEVKREYILFGDYILEGLGSETYPDGDKYVGEWKEGRENGQGIYIGSDGSKYVGEWKDGNWNGQGTFTFGKGDFVGNKYVGEWKNNKKWNGTGYDKNGNIQVKFVNGEYIKQ